MDSRQYVAPSRTLSNSTNSSTPSLSDEIDVVTMQQSVAAQPESLPQRFFCPVDECYDHVWFWSRKDLRQHFTEFHTVSDGYRCDECEMVFGSVAERAAHRNTHRRRPPQRPAQPRRVGVRRVIFRQYQAQQVSVPVPSSSTTQTVVQCEACTFRSSNIADFCRHMRQAHPHLQTASSVSYTSIKAFKAFQSQ